VSTLPIVNPHLELNERTPQAVGLNGHEPESLDDLFNKEVNATEAEQGNKRNMAPAGTYVTDPEEFPPTISPAKYKEDRQKDGTVTGKRLFVTVTARASATIRGAESTQVLRFDLSPEQRHKKIWDNTENKWTGEFDEAKDDNMSKLWFNAVGAYQDFHGKGTTFTQGDVLEFLKAVPVALRTMQGDRGELVVLSLSSRGRRSRG